MTCVIPGCERVAKSRGLCECCYHAARAKVKTGPCTWGLFEQAGLSVPAKCGTSKPGAFETAFKCTVAKSLQTDNQDT